MAKPGFTTNASTFQYICFLNCYTKVTFGLLLIFMIPPVCYSFLRKAEVLRLIWTKRFSLEIRLCRIIGKAGEENPEGDIGETDKSH
jgi:hypothetical protein